MADHCCPRDPKVTVSQKQHGVELKKPIWPRMGFILFLFH